MSENIKLGDNVWNIENGSIIGPFKVILVKRAGNIYYYDEVEDAIYNDYPKNLTTKDPHAPKVPEWMPGEGYELWEEKGRDNYIFHSPNGKGSYTLSGLKEHQLHSFAVQAGDGKVHLTTCPIWYTEEGDSHIWSIIGKGDIQAKLLGCVMRKAVE